MADENNKKTGNGEPPKIKLRKVNGEGLAQPKAPEEVTKPASESGPVPPKLTSEEIASKTQAIKLSSSEAQDTSAPPELDETTLDQKSLETQLEEAVKKATMRVEIDPADLPKQGIVVGTGAASAKKETSKIDLKEALAKQEQQAPSSGQERPKTIKIKKPDAPAQQPLAAAGEEPQVTSIIDLQDTQKSETARIDLPAGAAAAHPPTRPKTIRIKRPEPGTKGKTLTLARPQPASTVSDSSEEDSEEEDVIETEEVGIIFSIMTLAAVLVASVLVYVLAAQTMAPDLPWPGKII